MDSDHDEIRRLLRRTLEATEDTNRIVRKMHRAALWGSFFRLLWWVVILAASGVAFLYLQPYLKPLIDLYSTIGASGQSNVSQQLQQLLQLSQ